MRAKTLRWLGTVVFVAVGTSWALAQQSPPPSPPPAKEDSVAEAARKARAARAKSKTRKVYTEDDLPGLKKGTVSVVGEEPPAAAAGAEESVAPAEGGLAPLLGGPGAPASPASPGSPTVPDEAYWRERAGKLRSEVADVDRQIETLREEIRKGGGAGFDPQSGLGQNVIYYTDRNSRLQRLQQRRDELQKQMDSLLDEARKAGVPPGWLR